MERDDHKLPRAPRFRTDAEEAAFWDTHDTMDYQWTEVDRETLRPLVPQRLRATEGATGRHVIARRKK